MRSKRSAVLLESGAIFPVVQIQREEKEREKTHWNNLDLHPFFFHVCAILDRCRQ